MDYSYDPFLLNSSLGDSFFSSSFRIPTDITLEESAKAWDSVWSEATQFTEVNVKEVTSNLRSKCSARASLDISGDIICDGDLERLLSVRKIARKRESLPGGSEQFSRDVKRSIRVLACSDVGTTFEDTWRDEFAQYVDTILIPTILKPFSRYNDLRTQAAAGKYTEQALTDWSLRILVRQTTLLRLLLLDSPRLKHALSIVSLVSAIADANDDVVKTLLRQADAADRVGVYHDGAEADMDAKNPLTTPRFAAVNAIPSAALNSSATASASNSLVMSLLTPSPARARAHTHAFDASMHEVSFLTVSASASASPSAPAALVHVLEGLRQRARTVFLRLTQWCVATVTDALDAAIAYDAMMPNSSTDTGARACHPLVRVVARVASDAARAGEQLCATRLAITGQVAAAACATETEGMADEEEQAGEREMGEEGKGAERLRKEGALSVSVQAALAVARVIGDGQGDGHAMDVFQRYCEGRFSGNLETSEIPEELVSGCSALFASVCAYVRGQGVEDEEEVAGHVLSLCSRYIASADALQRALSTLRLAARTPLSATCINGCSATLHRVLEDYLQREYGEDWASSAALGLDEWLGAAAAPVLKAVDAGVEVGLRDGARCWTEKSAAMFGEAAAITITNDSATAITSNANNTADYTYTGNDVDAVNSMDTDWSTGVCGANTINTGITNSVHGTHSASTSASRCSCARFHDLCVRACQLYVAMRAPQMFDIMTDYPASAPCLADLSFCTIIIPESSHILSEALLSQFAKKLYQPAAPTSLILTQLINAAKISIYIDLSATVLAELVTRTRNCLLERPDALFHVARALRGMGPLPLSELVDPRVVPPLRVAEAACSMERIAERAAHILSRADTTTPPALLRALNALYPSLCAPPLLSLFTDATPLQLPSLAASLPSTPVAAELQQAETVMCSLYAGMRARASAAVETGFHRLAFTLHARTRARVDGKPRMSAHTSSSLPAGHPLHVHDSGLTESSARIYGSPRAPETSRADASGRLDHTVRAEGIARANPLLCVCGALQHHSFALFFLSHMRTSVARQLAPTVKQLYHRLLDARMPSVARASTVTTDVDNMDNGMGEQSLAPVAVRVLRAVPHGPLSTPPRTPTPNNTSTGTGTGAGTGMGTGVSLRGVRSPASARFLFGDDTPTHTRTPTHAHIHTHTHAHTHSTSTSTTASTSAAVPSTSSSSSPPTPASNDILSLLLAPPPPPSSLSSSTLSSTLSSSPRSMRSRSLVFRTSAPAPDAVSLLEGDNSDEEAEPGALPASLLYWAPQATRHALGDAPVDGQATGHATGLPLHVAPPPAPPKAMLPDELELQTRTLALSPLQARHLRCDWAFLCAAMAPSKRALFHALRDHTAQTVLARADMDMGVEEEVLRLERLKTRFGDNAFTGTEVILHDMRVSRRVATRVRERAIEDQRALALFLSFRSRNMPGNAALPVPVPRMPLAQDTPKLSVLLVSRELWPENWEKMAFSESEYMLSQTISSQRLHTLSRLSNPEQDAVIDVEEATSAADGMLKGALAIFASLPATVELCEELEEPLPHVGEEEDEDAAATAFPKPFDTVIPPDQCSAHMRYDASACGSTVAIGKATGNPERQVYLIEGPAMRVPHCAFELMNDFARLYHIQNSPRTIAYRLCVGTVELEIEIAGIVKTFLTSPLCASVLCCFGDESGYVRPSLSTEQVALIVNMPRSKVAIAIQYWCAHGVLQFAGQGQYHAVA